MRAPAVHPGFPAAPRQVSCFSFRAHSLKHLLAPFLLPSPCRYQCCSTMVSACQLVPLTSMSTPQPLLPCSALRLPAAPHPPRLPLSPPRRIRCQGLIGSLLALALMLVERVDCCILRNRTSFEPMPRNAVVGEGVRASILLVQPLVCTCLPFSARAFGGCPAPRGPVTEDCLSSYSLSRARGPPVTECTFSRMAPLRQATTADGMEYTIHGKLHGCG